MTNLKKHIFKTIKRYFLAAEVMLGIGIFGLLFALLANSTNMIGAIIIAAKMFLMGQIPILSMHSMASLVEIFSDKKNQKN